MSKQVKVFIRDWRLDNSSIIQQNSLPNSQKPMTIFYSDVEPLSKYSPAMLHLSPATRIANHNENPATSLSTRTRMWGEKVDRQKRWWMEDQTHWKQPITSANKMNLDQCN